MPRVEVPGTGGEPGSRGADLFDAVLFRSLLARARALAGTGRRLLGIAGPPGAGTSTLAAALVDALGRSAVLVPMDGFHLDDVVLRDLGRLARKGAPDTFDAAGYTHLLRRLRDDVDGVVYAPSFDRHREQSVAGAIGVAREVPLVVTEGNYLLLDGSFAGVRPLLDECWYLDVDADVQRARLVERHVRHGRSAQEARAWVGTVDDANTLLVAASLPRADLVIRPDAGRS